jgi:hypothetical protein
MCASGASAQGKGSFAYEGFSGGMMFHTGYLSGGDITLSDASGNTFRSHLSGAPTGLGGVARIHLGKHLRLGGEGHVSTLKYGGSRNDSHARIGWGGVLADVIWQFGRWSPYAGMTVGGGSFKNLMLADPTPLDNVLEEHASFRNYSFMILSPFAGIEYSITDKMRLNLKADWIVNLSNRQPDFAGGPRLYFGFTFYRLKERK